MYQHNTCPGVVLQVVGSGNRKKNFSREQFKCIKSRASTRNQVLQNVKAGCLTIYISVNLIMFCLRTSLHVCSFTRAIPRPTPHDKESRRFRLIHNLINWSYLGQPSVNCGTAFQCVGTAKCTISLLEFFLRFCLGKATALHADCTDRVTYAYTFIRSSKSWARW